MSRKVKGTTKIGINFKNDYINRAEKMWISMFVTKSVKFVSR